jgi:hypothetical protein
MVAVCRNPQCGQVNSLVRMISAAILEDFRGVASVRDGGGQRFGGCFGGIKRHGGGVRFHIDGRLRYASDV